MSSLALIAIGFELTFPRLEGLLEGPLSRIPQKPITSRSNGVGLGLALGGRREDHESHLVDVEISRRSDHRH